MNAVETWAKDKHPLIAILAPQLAAFAREIPDIIYNHKKHQLPIGKSTLPRLTSWYALYRNHRRYFVPFLKMLSEVSEFVGQLASSGLVFHENPQDNCETSSPTLSEDDQRIARHFWLNVKELSFSDLRADFEDRRLDGQTTATVESYLQQFGMEFSFVFLVFLPCFMLYRG